MAVGTVNLKVVLVLLVVLVVPIAIGMVVAIVSTLEG